MGFKHFPASFAAWNAPIHRCPCNIDGRIQTRARHCKETKNLRMLFIHYEFVNQFVFLHKKTCTQPSEWAENCFSANSGNRCARLACDRSTCHPSCRQVYTHLMQQYSIILFFNLLWANAAATAAAAVHWATERMPMSQMIQLIICHVEMVRDTILCSTVLALNHDDEDRCHCSGNVWSRAHTRQHQTPAITFGILHSV